MDKVNVAGLAFFWAALPALGFTALRVGPEAEYRTIQAAVDAVPAGNASEAVIEIEPGVYEEHVLVPREKPFVTMRAKESGKVVVRSGESVYTIKDKMLPRCTALEVHAVDFTAEGMVFDNYASRANVEAGGRGVGQALAVKIDADRAVFRDCSFLGHQDTLMADGPHDGKKHARQYYERCHIEGTVDFIFGCATAVFNDCDIRFVSHGYATAASTHENQPFGYVFVGCRLSGREGIKKSHLGRPWRPCAKTVFIGCEFADVLKPEGWSNWRNPENEKTAWYGEFGCTGPGSGVSGRAGWVHTGTMADADGYFSARGAKDWKDVLSGKDGWNPFGGKTTEASNAATNTFHVGASHPADSTHFTTVQAAVDAVPDSGEDIHVIEIAAGTYREKVSLRGKKNIIMKGCPAHPENCVIQYNAASSTTDPSTGEGYGTDGSATFTIGNHCDNLEFIGITFDNCATREKLAQSGERAGQALAMLIHDYSGRQTFRRCRFLGHQDTLEPKTGLSYFEDCYIEGDVDFIFAGAPTLFNRCELHCLSSNARVTAGSADPWRKVAFLFYRCRVTAPDGVHAVLGRSWYPAANVWFVDCDYGNAITAAGWERWNDRAGETTLREYGCRSGIKTARPNGAGEWAEGILVTGTIGDFWREFSGFGYSDLRDILFCSGDGGIAKTAVYKPEIRPEGADR